MVIKEVNLDAEHITDLVDTRTLRTHNAGDEFPADLEFGGLEQITSQSARCDRHIEAWRRTHIAVNNLVVLRGLDDLLDFLHRAVDVGADTTNDDDVLRRRITSIRTKLNGQRLVFTDDTVQS